MDDSFVLHDLLESLGYRAWHSPSSQTLTDTGYKTPPWTLHPRFWISLLHTLQLLALNCLSSALSLRLSDNAILSLYRMFLLSTTYTFTLFAQRVDRLWPTYQRSAHTSLHSSIIKLRLHLRNILTKQQRTDFDSCRFSIYISTLSLSPTFILPSPSPFSKRHISI